jgi:CubicO group peptidase (beta-lactamase class C family)
MTHPAAAARTITAVALTVAPLFGVACGGSTPAEPSAPAPAASLSPVAETADWPASTPAAEGIDPAPLLEALTRIRRGDYGRLDSLLIARHERLVMEEYFNGWTAEAAHTQQSVTKSVTSLAAGLAIDRGALALDDPVTPFFPDYQPIASLDANKQALTVRDLLTMRTGLAWSEANYAGSPLERLNTCSCDWIRFLLDWPMREPPGARWEYVSGGVILLGAVIGRATGTPVDVLLEEDLFGPLAFGGVRWARGQPQGLPHTGGGLFLRPRDMAKLGTLALTGGSWQGRPIVSARWMRESTQARPETVGTFGGQPTTYGYLWWGLPGGVITAAGAQGQWIFAVPARDLVVVSTANNPDARWDSAVRILYELILPATRP